MALVQWLGDKGRLLASDMLAKIGLPRTQAPWRSGTFSDVYEIPSGKYAGALLRLTVIVAQPTNREAVYGMFFNTVTVAKLAGNLMPARYLLQMRDEGVVNNWHCAVFASIIERLDAVPVNAWLDKFSSPKALLRALLTAGRELHARGVVHRDVSHNNVICAYRPLENAYRFLFIDSDDACVLPVGLTCSDWLGGTPGYTLPEIAIRSRSAPEIGQQKNEIAVFLGNSRPFDGNEMYNHSTLALVHNMVHALIMLGIVAILRIDDAYTLIMDLPKMRLDAQWKAFLAQACTLETSRRFTFETALQAVEALSEHNTELAADPRASAANTRDFELVSDATLGSLGPLDMLAGQSAAAPPFASGSLRQFLQQHFFDAKPRTSMAARVSSRSSQKRRVTGTSSARKRRRPTKASRS
jgi:hypothetical protein